MLPTALLMPAPLSLAARAGASVSAWRTAVVIVLLSGAVPAAAQALWTDVAEDALRLRGGERITTPTDFRLVRLDVSQMTGRLGTVQQARGGRGPIPRCSRSPCPTAGSPTSA